MAPTPSGYLHQGNLFNFILTWVSLKWLGGTVGLRIDDIDPNRSRAGYIESIFKTLDWLGLDWAFGPQTVAEQAAFSFQNQQGELEALAKDLFERKQAFACDCSRKQLRESGAGFAYPGICRHQNKNWEPGKNVLRLATPASADNPMGETVIWSRDNYASYQLASVRQDHQDRINLLIRGEDLHPSSQFQQKLAAALQIDNFNRIFFYHHPLLTGSHGEKLSKSSGSQAHPLYESGLNPADLIKQTAAFINLDPQHLATPRDLLHKLQDQTG